MDEAGAGLLSGFLFGFGGLDVADGALDGAVGVGENLLRLAAGSADDLLAAGLEVVVEALVFGGHLVEELVGHAELLFLAGNLLLVELELLELVLEVELLATHHLAGAEENLLGETDALGNLEGEAAAGVTHS